MKKLGLFLIVALTLPTGVFGQDTPKAVITGPLKVGSAKTAITIRTEGSVGKLKFAMSPKIPQSFSFKDEQTGELVFLYIPETDGVYSVALAASTPDGKLDVQILQTQVGSAAPVAPVIPPVTPVIPPVIPPVVPPVVPPVISDLGKIVADKAATDLAAGVGTKQHLQDLADIYRAASKVTVYNAAMTKPQDIYNTMHAAAVKKNIGDGALPGTRKALTDHQAAYFKFIPGALLEPIQAGVTTPTRDKMAAKFVEIADALTATAQQQGVQLNPIRGDGDTLGQ